MDKDTKDYLPGETAVLMEEGGAAVCQIISRSDDEHWIGFKVRFTKIIAQFPFVPYEPGDEIEIGFNTKYARQPGCWYFLPSEEDICVLRV